MTRPQAVAGTVAVTGASRGLGAAIALELAKRGYSVACLSRGGGCPEVKEDTAPEVIRRLSGYRCDITDRDSVEAAMSEAGNLPGGLKGLVNCAGIVAGGPACEFALDDFEAILRTNVTGTFSVCQAAYPLLVEQGGGLIVNLGSFWDRMGIKRYTAYCASKAAIASLTRCLGVEWARQGIRVLDVAPGFTETTMQSDDNEVDDDRLMQFLANRLPGGRRGRVDEIARVVAGLFSENVEFLNATTIYIDGGQGPAL